MSGFGLEPHGFNWCAQAMQKSGLTALQREALNTQHSRNNGKEHVMKKQLTLTVLSALALVTMAQEQKIDDVELEEIIFRQLCSGRAPNMGLDENGNLTQFPPRPTAEGIAKMYSIPHEQMTRVLEKMIRENLPVINNGKGKTRNVEPLIKALQTFHNFNTIALLKECMATPREPMRDSIFYDAVQTYLVIEGAEAIPFLREAIAKRGSQPVPEETLKFYQNVMGLQFTSAAQPPRDQMQKAVIRHIQENKTANSEELMSFLKELGIPEPQEPPKPTNDVTKKDEVKQEEQQEEEKEE